MSRVCAEAASQFTHLLVQETQFLLFFLTQLNFYFELLFWPDGRDLFLVNTVLLALPHHHSQYTVYTHITPGPGESSRAEGCPGASVLGLGV